MKFMNFRPNPWWLAIVVSFSLLARADILQRAPYLQMGSPDGMTVSWRTDVASESVVYYGDAVDNLTLTATDTSVDTNHSVRITGLSPSTRYYYAVADSSGAVLAGNDATHFFETSPSVGSADATRIWIIGDSGTANSNATAVYDAYKTMTGSTYTDLWIMLGDNAYNTGTDVEYQAAVFNIYGDLLKQSPLWSTLGNHDGASADSASQTGPYYDIFSLPAAAEVGGVASGTEAYYSFDYGQIHFVCLDSYETNRDVGSAMLTWLDYDLAATTQPWIVAFWHHPPYTKGSHNSDTEARLIEMRENALPILESYGVDLVLSGHSHSYERSYMLDSHYGNTSTFNEAMKLDAGDGRTDGTGSYDKLDRVKEPNDGTVYIVAGSSGKISGGTLDHPAMYASINKLGSVVLEAGGNELNATFIDHTNAVQDYFTITKGPDTLVPTVTAVDVADETSILVTYSEKVDLSSATNTANYLVDYGITVWSADLDESERVVTLTTTQLPPSVEHTLSISGVEDLNGNTLQSPTDIAFTFINLTTMEFQHGVSPDANYDGARDSYIAEANVAGNYGANTTLLVDGSDADGNGNYHELASLLHWDVSAIPADATIESASMSFEVFDPSGSSYTVYALLQPWVETEVSWAEYASGSAWSVPGAKGVSDRQALALATISPTTGIFTANLNNDGIATVQAWVNGSMDNHGLMMADDSSSDGFDFYSREGGSFKPKLTVVYSQPVSSEDTEAPTAPTNLNATSAGTDSASLAWNASSDNVAVVGYKIFRDDVQIDMTTGTSYNDSGLAEGSSYSYQVTAYDAANNESPFSNQLELTTDSTTSNVHVEDIAISLVQVSRKKIRADAIIIVQDNLANPVSGATVQGTWSGLTSQQVSGLTLTDGSISFASANVNSRSNGDFVFSVTSVSAAGSSYDPADNVESSDCIGSDGSSCGGLSAPANLQGSYNGSAVSLNWSSVFSAEGYNVYRSNVSGSGYAFLGSSGTTSYSDASIADNQVYYYIVTAAAGGLESDDSSEVTVNTTVSGPAVVSIDDVTLTIKRKGSRYDATATVQILDDTGGSVASATVDGYWTMPDSSTSYVQLTTSSTGSVSTKSARVSAQSGDSFSFTVTDVQHGGGSFDGTQVTGTIVIQ